MALDRRYIEFITYDQNGCEYRETVHVYNTYPLFLQIKDDMEKGKYLYTGLEGLEWKRNFENFIVFAERVNTSLLKFVQGVYHEYKDKFPYYVKLVDITYENKIEIIKYNSYNLIFIRMDDKVFFMNYLDIKYNITENNFVKYLIPKYIKNKNYHVRNISINGFNYNAINTHYAFWDYAEKNGRTPRKELNIDFFGALQHSIDTEKSKHATNNEFIVHFNNNRKTNEYDRFELKTDMKFRYLVIGNMLMIYEYYHKNEDEICFINRNEDDIIEEYAQYYC